VELNETGATSRYARLLAWGVRAGLGLLVLAFVAEAAGIASAVPLERMPALWSAPAHPRADWSAVLAAIAWLATCSVACLVPLLPILRRRGETTLAVICVLHVAVLALAVWAGSLVR
jgi:hypothetical protein